MLVNPTESGRKRRKKQKPLQLIFPNPVRRLRANLEYIDRARTRSKALVGNLTGKHVAGSLGGAAATIAVPNAMRLKGWSDVAASGAVSIGGGIAVKQMDEAAGDAFMLTGLGVTGLKAVKQLMRTAKGKTTRRRRRRSYRRSLEDNEFEGMDDIGIEDFGIDDFSKDEFLCDE
ncbi:MAG: hypothetical protein K0B37_18035 [Bacteroidales bacterium]|nr:hypothetical protein [Bacteroidales bacterium]